ncbi:YceI family protein [Shewanella glacialipiscicola]|uniref:YceI family protein n=1 Tax=Shewanella glacialipiscicola TaxID=614069 RepID=UPI0021DB1F88|nr:YceI family protein [Shewanella glacialipiscicola]MCU7996806.1 YceI family protein [Shewanella glacialipiscicola]MCU8028120.1 YceI family protein [Shewanella glacialipiscicola]
MKKWIGIVALSAIASFSCFAQWQVVEQDSRVSFVSVKKGDIAEVHHFKQLKGQLKDNGQFELTIPLIGVATGIDIRDERMQSLLFEVSLYPELKLSSQVDNKLIKELSVGESKIADIEGKISLHGKTQTKTFSVLITKITDNKLQVSSFQPVIVNANEFDLVAGVDKLREIAGLSSISQAVPVSFVLTLTQ